MAWSLSTGLKNALLGTSGLKEALANGQIRIYSGPQPDSADKAEQGALLCIITLNSGAMTSGVATNGINLGTPAGAQIGKAAGEVWSGLNLQTGTAGWMRWYPNSFNSNMGEDSTGTKIRLDGNCGTSGAQMILASVSLTQGVSTTVDNVSLAI